MTAASRAVTDANNMTDAQLDALLPAAVRQASRVYWTSVTVARRAAQILTHRILAFVACWTWGLDSTKQVGPKRKRTTDGRRVTC